MGPSPSAATTLSHVASRRHPAHWATYWSLRSLRTGVCDVSRMVLGACAACRWCDGVVVWCGVVLLLCAVGAFGSVPLLCFSVRRLAFPSSSPYAWVPCARAVPRPSPCGIQPKDFQFHPHGESSILLSKVGFAFGSGFHSNSQQFTANSCITFF